MSTPSLRLRVGLVRLPARVSSEDIFWSIVERMLAGALLIALLPALAVSSLAVALASRKSPFIAHRRVGRYGQDFWMLKVRTMWDRTQPSASKSAGWIEYLGDTHVPVFKGARDPRVTSRLALFCRRFSLDELPQLIHVLSGRMRLVGPRPVTRKEWNIYYGASAADVLSVSPGITGLWQVM
jgi:lipopolysaccharide/colanic/teichoic acid biosynthesis glycosyltransferase